jgi:RNA polymerase sigma factor (sigma-70 family)
LRVERLAATDPADFQDFPSPAGSEPGEAVEAAADVGPASEPESTLPAEYNCEELQALPKEVRQSVDATVRETSIALVVAMDSRSTRLTNSIRKADANGLMPLRTVGDYLDAGPAAGSCMLKIQDFGRKTAKELDTLVHEFVARGGFWADDEENEPEPPAPACELPADADITLAELVQEARASTRLTNCIIGRQIPYHTVGGYLLAGPDAKGAFLRIDGLGRNSVSELDYLVREYVAVVASRGPSSDLSEIGDDEAVQPAPPPADETPADLDDLIEDLLTLLPERQREVLSRRYGFGGWHAETLDEVGSDLGVTRERIRQIEKKALYTLATKKTKAALASALEDRFDEHWELLAQGRSWIFENEYSQIMQLIPGEHALAIDLAFGGAYAWMQAVAHEWRYGFYRCAEVDDLLLEAALAALNTELDGRPMPALQIDPPGFSRAASDIALNLGSVFRTQGAYIDPDGFTRRKRRAIGLHRILRSIGVAPKDVAVRAYRSAFPEDLCNVRDLEIAVFQMPHLFLKVDEDSRWAVGDAEPIELPDISSANSSPKRLASEASLTGTIRQALEELGPSRFIDVRSMVLSRRQDISAASVGPVMILSEEFERVLPGVYALKDHGVTAAQIVSDAPAFMLTDEQVRFYAMARFAGETELFPLWTPAAEYAWCRWAQVHSEPRTFKSLLAIIEPSAWPVSEEEKTRWRSIASMRGNYQLTSELRHPMQALWPPLDRVLAAAVWLERYGAISWMSADRVLRKPIDAHVSAGLLALLVSLGAANDPRQWQQGHTAAYGVGRLIRLLERELSRRGRLSWTSDVGQELKLQADRASVTRSPRGWVDGYVIEELVQGSGSGSALPTSVGEAEEFDQDPVEQMLAQMIRQDENETAQSLLDELTK